MRTKKKLPLKIVYKRKKNYTVSQQPYRQYLYADWNWNDIFEYISKIKTNDKKYIKTASIVYGVNYNTLKNKYSKYTRNMNSHLQSEHRGGHNKIFTENEERKIYEYIKNEYIGIAENYSVILFH